MDTVIYTEETLAVGTHWTDIGPGTNGPITLYDQRSVHAFDLALVGSGTVTITPYTSITGAIWINNGAKLSGFGSSDGPDADGKQAVALRLIPGNLIRFKIVVADDSVTLTMGFTQK